jgi:putative transcriptional regulator
MDKSILETVHESAKDMLDIDLLDKQTMREFDALCLPEVTTYTARQIKQIRMRNKISQPVFAMYLNTGVETVRKWEAEGKTNKRPSGAAMKLINMVALSGIGILGGQPESATSSRVRTTSKKSAPRLRVRAAG